MKIAVLSDIHANIYALEAVFEDIDRNGCEKILVLGDLVGYYYWPKKVVNKIRNDPRCIVIKGNHEELLERCLRDVEFSAKCHKKYGSGFIFCQQQLSEDETNWLRLLPSDTEVVINGINIGLYHGSDRSTNEYIYPDTNESRLAKISTKHDFMFFGHTHYPMTIQHGNCVIINPGSVGQPRDIGSLASYVILNTQNRAIINRRISFDIQPLQIKSQTNDPHYPYLHEIFLRK